MGYEYRLNTKTGVVHKLIGGCKKGNGIIADNSKDFYTYAEAEMAAKNCGKDARKCAKCKW